MVSELLLKLKDFYAIDRLQKKQNHGTLEGKMIRVNSAKQIYGFPPIYSISGEVKSSLIIDQRALKRNFKINILYHRRLYAFVILIKLSRAKFSFNGVAAFLLLYLLKHY